MTQVVLFWFLTLMCVACAGAFVIPPLRLVLTDRGFGLGVPKSLTIAIALGTVIIAYLIYFQLGASAKLEQYYSVAAQNQRSNNRQMRPYHARLQRELVKNQLNLAVDPKNIDIIIRLAEIHSKLSAGILQLDLKKLLQSILVSVPDQIIVLNLLAVDAYNSEAYSLAVEYWQRILKQFTPQMRGSAAEKILKNKIMETNAKISLFESRRTK